MRPSLKVCYFEILVIVSLSGLPSNTGELISKKMLLIGDAGFVGATMASHLLSLVFALFSLDLFLCGYNLSVVLG